MTQLWAANVWKSETWCAALPVVLMLLSVHPLLLFISVRCIQTVVLSLVLSSRAFRIRVCHSSMTQQYVSFQLWEAVFLIWLFSTCCWSYCPSLSEQARDNISFSTMAAGSGATLWLSGCDTKCVHLIYSSSSLCMSSVRTAWCVTFLAKKIWEI